MITTTTATRKLLKLEDALAKPFSAELEEGQHIGVKLTAYKTQHGVNADYLEMKFTLENGTVYTRNMFSNDIVVMAPALRLQLGLNLTSYPSIGAFLAYLLKEQVTFDTWVKYVIVKTASGKRRKQNIYFAKPYDEINEADETETPLTDEERALAAACDEIAESI